MNGRKLTSDHTMMCSRKWILAVFRIPLTMITSTIINNKLKKGYYDRYGRRKFSRWKTI